MKPIPLTETQMAELFRIRDENEALRARLAEIEAQEPVAFAYYSDKYKKPMLEQTENARGYEGEWKIVPLYAAPVVIPDAEKLKAEIADLQVFCDRLNDRRNSLVGENQSLKTELEAARKDAEWISVDDRLPERYTEVMVWPHPSEQAMTAQFGLIRKKSAPMWHYSEYISGFGWEEQECNPTHWKPLPAPPAIEQAKGGVK